MNAIAIDLGASGGKVFVGRFDGRQLEVYEIYRFPNDPVRVSGHLLAIGPTLASQVMVEPLTDMDAPAH